MPIAFGPRILLDPSFGITVDEIRSKFKGAVKISKDATLVLYGLKTQVEDITLDRGHHHTVEN